MFKSYKSPGDSDENVEIGEGVKFVGGSAVIKVAPGGFFRCGKGCTFHHSEIRIETGASVVLGDNCIIRGEIAVHHKGSSVKIGDNLVCNDKVRIRAGEGKSISIGNDCLFANAFIYCSDYHGLYDRASGKRINGARDVSLGDRVWVAHNSMILKGACIGHDSVVGAGSVVTGKCPSYAVVAGNPAAVIRTGVSWTRDARSQIDPVEKEAERPRWQQLFRRKP